MREIWPHEKQQRGGSSSAAVLKENENTKDLDKDKALCKMCKIEEKYCANTITLRNHLRRRRPETDSTKAI